MIDSDDLKAIFSEMAFTDSYLTNLTSEIRRDSVRIFEPILKSKGYDINDFNYTISKLSLRKSSVLPVILDEAATELGRKMAIYKYNSEISLRWDERVKRNSRQLLVLDSAKIKSVNDTKATKFTVYPSAPGSYDLFMRYKIDSLDTNKSHITSYTISDTLKRYKSYSGSIWLNRNKDRKFETAKTSLDINTHKYNKLEVQFISFSNLNNSNITAPKVRVDTMMISYYPPLEKARRDAIKQFFGYPRQYKKFELYEKPEKNSSSLLLYVEPPYKRRSTNNK